MRELTIEQPEPLPTIHVFEAGEHDDGTRWACAAYDHGPLCRLCQPVDEMLAALLVNVREGKMTARARSDGEMEFQLTAQGKVAAEEMIGTKPAMAELWAQLQRRHPGPDAAR